MKAIFRNFLSAVRRYQAAVALNTLGLSVAFAAFIIIMMQLGYERSFDRCHSNAERIALASYTVNGSEHKVLPRAMVDLLIASSPHIEAGTIIQSYDDEIRIVYGDSSSQKGMMAKLAVCYPAISRMFDFEFTEGSADCLNEPDKAIIPQSMAERMFGTAEAVGQRIAPIEKYRLKDAQSWTVGGVYRDFPGNTQLNNAIYTRIGSFFSGEWNGSNFHCYLMFDSKEAARTFAADVQGKLELPDFYKTDELSVNTVPLTDIYFSKAGNKSGNAGMVNILFLVAILVVAIAAINYTNFSIALAPVRIQSINTQRILGATAPSIRLALLSEALFVALGAWTVSLFIVHYLGRYSLLPFIEADLSLFNSMGLISATGIVALTVGLIAGLYPAWYATSFQPALALRGNFALSPSGRAMRNGLVCFQYVASFVLIISSLFVQLQNRYMKNYDAGFDKEQIAVVEAGRPFFNRHKDVYASRLMEFPVIEEVAFSSQKLGSRDFYTSYPFEFEGVQFEGDLHYVSPNFLSTMNINVRTGRNFLDSDTAAENLQPIIINRAMQESLKLELGSIITSFDTDRQVIGILGDVKFTSLRKDADKLAFTVASGSWTGASYIRIKAGANVRDAVAVIRETVADIDPAYPIDVEFYDELSANMYSKENSLSRSITMLGILAIIISVVGVFGLVMFETQRRRKEISIRKVHGATVGAILGMFNKVYIRIVVVCFILAAPLAWYAVSVWLENFAYKTPIHLWVFAASFAIVALVTLATVTLQNWRAANMNPVESVKSE